MDTRPVTRLDIEHRAGIVAESLISGGTIKEGMRTAGYSPSMIKHGLTKAMRSAVADVLEEHKNTHSQSIMKRFNQLARCADKAVGRIADDTADRLDIEKAKIQFMALKDYADRLGLSNKVSKSVGLKITADGTEDLKALKDRIEYLKGLSASNSVSISDIQSDSLDKTEKVLSVGYENSIETANEAQTTGKNAERETDIDRLIPDIASV